MKRGFFTIMAAQFFSSLADQALFIGALQLLITSNAPDWQRGLLVPLFAWWFGITLWSAFVMDLGLIVFFLCYTFVFNWVFDHLFGLPASAQNASLEQPAHVANAV